VPALIDHVVAGKKALDVAPWACAAAGAFAAQDSLGRLFVLLHADFGDECDWTATSSTRGAPRVVESHVMVELTRVATVVLLSAPRPLKDR
jgi:hypothetical protein